MIVVAIVVVALVSIYVWYQKVYYIPPVLAKMPGPSRIPFLGSVHHISKFVDDSWVKLQEKYGDVFFFKLLSANMIVVCDPVLIQTAVQMKDVLQRQRLFEYDAQIIGNVLFCIDGDDWKSRRTVLNPHFRSLNINTLFPTVAERAYRAVQYLEQFANKQVDVDLLFSSITLDVICQYLMSTTIDSSNGKPTIMTKFFKAINSEMNGMLLFPAFFYLPRPGKFRYLKYRHDFMKFLGEVIASRKGQNNFSEPRDILDVLLANKMNTKDIKDELVGLMFAGHDTTAHNLSFTLYHICKDEKVLKKVMDEVNSLTFNAKGEIANLEELAGLKYLTACVKETLRLLPQATGHPLTALEDTHLGDIPVPKNTIVLCNTQVVQRLSKYWPDPSVFRPERFLADDGIEVNGEKFESKKAPVYFPFLQGRHVCLGQHLVLLESRVVLATFLKHLNFYVKPDYAPRPVQAIGVPPEGGMWLTPMLKN